MSLEALRIVANDRKDAGTFKLELVSQVQKLSNTFWSGNSWNPCYWVLTRPGIIFDFSDEKSLNSFRNYTFHFYDNPNRHQGNRSNSDSAYLTNKMRQIDKVVTAALVLKKDSICKILGRHDMKTPTMFAVSVVSGATTWTCSFSSVANRDRFCTTIRQLIAAKNTSQKTPASSGAFTASRTIPPNANVPISRTPSASTSAVGYNPFDDDEGGLFADNSRQKPQPSQPPASSVPVPTKPSVPSHARSSSRQPHITPGALSAGDLNQMGSKKGGDVKELWPCPTCTYENVPSHLVCEMCGYIKQQGSSTRTRSQRQPVVPPSPSPSHHNSNNLSSDLNLSSNQVNVSVNRTPHNPTPPQQSYQPPRQAAAPLPLSDPTQSKPASVRIAVTSTVPPQQPPSNQRHPNKSIPTQQLQANVNNQLNNSKQDKVFKSKPRRLKDKPKRVVSSGLPAHSEAALVNARSALQARSSYLLRSFELTHPIVVRLPAAWGRITQLSCEYTAVSCVDVLKTQVAEAVRAQALQQNAQNQQQNQQPQYRNQNQNRSYPEEHPSGQSASAGEGNSGLWKRLEELQEHQFDLCLNSSGQGQLQGDRKVSKALQTEAGSMEMLYLIPRRELERPQEPEPELTVVDARRMLQQRTLQLCR